MKLPIARAVCVIGFTLAATLIRPISAGAHETDQYTLPVGRQFTDLGPYFNSFFYRAIEQGVEKTNAKIRAELAAGRDPARYQTPDEVTFAVNREFPYAIFLIEDLDKLMTSVRMKDRWPGTLPAYKPPPSMQKYLLYPLNPFRAWNCSTVKVYGVYLGTDKIGHFTDMGMHYWQTYRGYRAKGETEAQAIQRAIDVGSDDPVKGEAALLGYWTAGAYSNADLAVNYTGFLFYRNLTEPQMLEGEMRPPMLQREAEYWKLAPHVRPDSDFMAVFFSEHLDEALNPSHYLSQMRDGMRKMAAANASGILEHRLDKYGNRRSRAALRDLSRELRTYYGENYGHRGNDRDLVLLTDACFPADADEPADVRARDRFGMTALHRAAEVGDAQRVQQLLDAGAEVNAPIRSVEGQNSDWGNTPLHVAALHGHAEVARLLIAGGADVRLGNDRGSTPLHLAVERPDLLALLLEAGADPDARDARGRTALHWAAFGSALEGLSVLAERGADLNARDRDGQTPIHLAVRSLSAATVEALARLGADVRLPDAFGVTPLHLAASTPGHDVAEMLVNAGAPLDVRDTFGCTPLHEASRNGAEMVVALLLEAGAEPRIADTYGVTPLHVASRQGNPAIAQLLLAGGADANARAGSRGTPIDEAIRGGHRPVVSILRSADAGVGVAGHKPQ